MMLGNGVCNEACNREECGWDRFDCGCAPGCNFEDIGHCKSACLVAECNYDSLDGHSLSFSGLDTLACSTEKCVKEDAYKKTCSQTLMCGDNAFQVLLNCCETCCSAGYRPHPLNPVVCIRSQDVSSASSPKLIYVNQTSQGVKEDGSESQPFSSLRSALLRLYEKYTVIVFYPGQHKVEASGSVLLPFSMYSKNSILPTVFPHLSRLTLTTLDCLSGASECRRITFIHKLNAPPYFFFFEGIQLFEIKNVDFDSTINFSVCNNFCVRRYDLFPVSSHSHFRLENVSFRHFHNAMKSLINIDYSSVELVNVEFEDVMVRRTGLLIGLIFSANYANVTFLGGKVWLLNNGYDYEPRVFANGFLNAAAVDLRIERVEFAYNFVHFLDPKIADDYGSLLHITTCYSCVIAHSLFFNNIGSDGAILHFRGRNWGSQYSNSTVVPSILTSHLLVMNCTFRNNTGDRGSVMLIEQSNAVQELRVTNCTFESELSTVSGVLAFEISGTVGATDIVKNATNSQGRAYATTFPAVKLELSNLTFVNCSVASFGLISAKNIQSMRVSAVRVENCGSVQGTDLLSTTLAAFANLPDAYVPGNIPAITTYLCTSLLNFTSVATLAIDSLFGLTTECSTFLFATGDTLDMRNSVISGSQGTSLWGSSVQAEISTRARLSQCVFEGGKNANQRDGGTVSFIMTNLMVIDNCTFSRNSAAKGAALLLYSVAQAEISNSIFAANKGESGSSIYIQLLPFSFSTIRVNSCLFEQNSATTGSGLHFQLDQDTAFLSLALSDSRIVANTAEKGSAIYSSPGIQFEGNSGISACLIARNSASDGGTVHFEDTSGKIEIADCTFDENAGKIGAAVYRKCSISTAVCEIHFVSLSMSQNSGATIVDISGVLPTVIASSIHCWRNSGTCIALDSASLHCSNSTFDHNFVESGCVLHAVSSYVSFSACTFENNTAELMGGVALIEKNSRLECVDCFFRNNTAERGGALFVKQLSQVFVNRSIFERNSAKDSGFVLFLAMCENVSTIADSEMRENNGDGSGVIYTLSTSLSLRNCSVHDNFGGKLSSGLIIQLSSLDVSNCTFQNQSSNSGSFVYFIHSSAVITSSRFLQGKAAALGGAIAVLGTSVTISDCLFQQLSSAFGGAISLQNASNMTLANCILSAIVTQASKKGCIDSLNSALIIRDTTFANFTENGISGRALALLVANSSFSSKR